MKRGLFIFSGLLICCYAILIFGTGCAQIGFPTGGIKDTLAPVLVRASPDNETLNFTGNKVNIVFDEYIEVKDLQTNLLVSPLPKTNPTITSNLKSISIKLRDTLKPNTTYTLNFGNAIADVHEGNINRNFSYIFSTGDYIDSMEISGKVLLAETGKPDTTIQVLLYKDAPDTAISSRKPDYIAKLNKDGDFKFTHLPSAGFKIYALKDGDGGKTYNSKTETFAFNDDSLNTNEAVKPVMLYAYAEQKPDNNPSAVNTAKRPAEKKLKYATNLSNKLQDLLQPLQLTFNNGLKTFDTSQIIITDTNFKPLPNLQPMLDSSRTKVSITLKWIPETDYNFILPKESVRDSTDNFLEKSDTVRFSTKKVSDYGTLLLRFKNISISRHPVIQFLQGDAIKFSFPVSSAQWNNDRFTPGEYDVRILYDSNNNGVWDPGNFKSRLQPEQTVSLPQKIAIRADWDNEREIQL